MEVLNALSCPISEFLSTTIYKDLVHECYVSLI